MLSGIKYKVLPNAKIAGYVNSVARKEWSAQDFVKYGKDLEAKWTLKKIKVNKIKPNKKLLQSKSFQEDLLKRTASIRKAVAIHKALPPLILRSDMLIFDGYARWIVFKEMRIKECFAYVGIRK